MVHVHIKIIEFWQYFKNIGTRQKKLQWIFQEILNSHQIRKFKKRILILRCAFFWNKSKLNIHEFSVRLQNIWIFMAVNICNFPFFHKRGWNNKHSVQVFPEKRMKKQQQKHIHYQINYSLISDRFITKMDDWASNNKLYKFMEIRTWLGL